MISIRRSNLKIQNGHDRPHILIKTKVITFNSRILYRIAPPIRIGGTVSGRKRLRIFNIAGINGKIIFIKNTIIISNETIWEALLELPQVKLLLRCTSIKTSDQTEKEQ